MRTELTQRHLAMPVGARKGAEAHSEEGDKPRATGGEAEAGPTRTTHMGEGIQGPRDHSHSPPRHQGRTHSCKFQDP
jgi:hypothetical protein